jgi:hypothetical protein
MIYIVYNPKRRTPLRRLLPHSIIKVEKKDPIPFSIVHEVSTDYKP